MVDDVENLIRQRSERFKDVSVEMLSAAYLREIMDELTRLRFEIAGMRQAIGKMTGQ